MRKRLIHLIWMLPLLLGSVVNAASEDVFDLRGALEAQRAILEAQPRNAAALNDLGNLLYLGGDFESAAEAYSEALSIDPDHIPARFNLALLKQQQGHCRQAQWGYRKVLKRDRNHAWSRYLMGVCLEKRQKTKRAIRHYTRAFKLDPQLSERSKNLLLIDSRLRARAMLRAFAEGEPAALVPRTFAEPSRIAGLLLPEVLEDRSLLEPEAKPTEVEDEE